MLKKTSISVLLILSIVFVMVIYYAHTILGRLVFAFILEILFLPFVIILNIEKLKKIRLLQFFIALIVATFLTIIVKTPSNKNSYISSKYYNNQKLARFSIFNIFPESEQFNFGFPIMAKIDRLFTKEQSQKSLEITHKIYDQLENDENFKDLPSAMGLAYSEYFTSKTKYGHYFKMCNPKSDQKLKPLMIFLHGSFGNFKGYMWVLSKLVDEFDFVIVAPSYGAGNWHIGNSTEVIQDVLEDVLDKEKIDMDKIYLCGISNGGIGVSLFSLFRRDLISKIILLSPVMPKLFITDDYSLKMQNVEFLIISGNKDRRIPPKYIQDRYKSMLDNKLNVNLNILDDSDHFMLFAQPDSVMKIISNWLNKDNDSH